MVSRSATVMRKGTIDEFAPPQRYSFLSIAREPGVASISASEKSRVVRIDNQFERSSVYMRARSISLRAGGIRWLPDIRDQIGSLSQR